MTPKTLTKDVPVAAPVGSQPAPEPTAAEKVAAEKRVRLMALLQSWMDIARAGGPEAEEMRETGQYLMEALKTSRLEIGTRLHFLPDSNGGTE